MKKTKKMEYTKKSYYSKTGKEKWKRYYENNKERL